MPHASKKPRSSDQIPPPQLQAGGAGQRCQSWTPRGHLRSSGQQRVPVASSGQSWLRAERTFPRSPRLGAAGRGLAWHPRRAPAALAAGVASPGGGAAAARRAEQGRREPAARPRPGIRPPSPRPGRRRPAQRLSGCAGTRQLTPAPGPPGSTTPGSTWEVEGSEERQCWLCADCVHSRSQDLGRTPPLSLDLSRSPSQDRDHPSRAFSDHQPPQGQGREKRSTLSASALGTAP